MGVTDFVPAARLARHRRVHLRWQHLVRTNLLLSFPREFQATARSRPVWAGLSRLRTEREPFAPARRHSVPLRPGRLLWFPGPGEPAMIWAAAGPWRAEVMPPAGPQPSLPAKRSAFS